MSEITSIFNEIKKANSILLHCHPSPDPDSVGSVLAMKYALESLGKKVTAIQGDNNIPQAFMHFPGAETILKKNIFEVDLSEFDLFLALDCSVKGVSRLKDPVYPESLTVINIDHHKTNTGFGSISLIDPRYPANCLLLHKLFKEWGIAMTPEIASNLFIGSYTDTGGFKYPGVTAETFAAISEIVPFISDLPRLISTMENSNTPGLLTFEALALNSIEVNGSIAVSKVSFKEIKDRGVSVDEAKPGIISSILKTVPQWNLAISAVETDSNVVKFSFRSVHVDVSKLAAELGGGGHPGAAGATLAMPIDDAVKKVVETAKMLYNL